MPTLAVVGGRVVVVVPLKQQEDQAIAAKRRLTVSMETGRLTASGCSVSGNATVRRRGRTGLLGRVGGVGSPCGFGPVYQVAAWLSRPLRRCLRNFPSFRFDAPSRFR